jgi:hypothetical protein
MLADDAMTVIFQDGKGFHFRGIYTVHTHLPAKWKQEVTEYLRRFTGPAELLFPAEEDLPLAKRMSAMCRAIRVANPKLSLKSLRRGSLQTMAQNGTPIDTLMTFSGHKEVETLKRYLDWGRLLGTATTQGVLAARPLAGSL